MKIISKYKDYYDYLVGKWGEDPLIVLDRRDYRNPSPYYFSDFEKITLYICDRKVEGLYKSGKFYYGKNVEPFDIKHKKGIKLTKWYRYIYDDKERYTINGGGNIAFTINKFPEKSNLNTKLGIPILMIDKHALRKSESDISNFYTYPILKDLGLQTLFSPEEMWLMLSEFLAPKDNTIDKRTNSEKILSKGFDLKTSFRGK
jgi:hypothetical protein